MMKNNESVFDKLARESEERNNIENAVKNQQNRISEISEQVAKLNTYQIITEFVMWHILPMLLEISKSRLDKCKPLEQPPVTALGNIIHEVALQRYYAENNLSNHANSDSNSSK